MDKSPPRMQKNSSKSGQLLLLNSGRLSPKSVTVFTSPKHMHLFATLLGEKLLRYSLLSLLLSASDDGWQAVSQGSATVGAIFERHIHLDNTSHITMCKFNSRDDLNYNTLMLRIKNEFEDNSIKRAGTGSSFGSQKLKRQETQKQLQEIRDQIAKGDARVEKVQTGASIVRTCGSYLLSQIKVFLSPMQQERNKVNYCPLCQPRESYI